ncbi:histone-lysine N-methyltransferase SMYD3-like [Brevipalpus obovatus]|uniref:histone-lysine N-methyltransferase SMYD3-like n=1 Tax=Brevipalpus obovatus TaxID=246614 RepID=UPI003D9DF475
MVKYKPSDVILECSPLVYYIDLTCEKVFCNHCLREWFQLFPCPACGSIFYCSKLCAAKDWESIHQWECKYYRKSLKSSTEGISLLASSSHARFMLRMMIIANRFPEKLTKVFDTPFGSRCFNQLEDHRKKILEQENGIGSLAYPIAHELHEMGFQFDAEQFINCYCRVQVNSFSIYEASRGTIGTGMYVAAAIFNHSCKPNCCQFFTGTRMQVKAIREFDTKNEPPVVSYINPRLPKAQRIALLNDCYFFSCQCSRCIGSEEFPGINLMDLEREFSTLVSNHEYEKAFRVGLKSLKLTLRIVTLFFPPTVTFFFQLIQVAEKINHPNFRSFKIIWKKNCAITQDLENSVRKFLDGINLGSDIDSDQKIK